MLNSQADPFSLTIKATYYYQVLGESLVSSTSVLDMQSRSSINMFSWKWSYVGNLLTFHIHYGFNKYFKTVLGSKVSSSKACCEPLEQSLFLNWSLTVIIFVKMIHAEIKKKKYWRLASSEIPLIQEAQIYLLSCIFKTFPFLKYQSLVT